MIRRILRLRRSRHCCILVLVDDPDCGRKMSAYGVLPPRAGMIRSQVTPEDAPQVSSPCAWMIPSPQRFKLWSKGVIPEREDDSKRR